MTQTSLWSTTSGSTLKTINEGTYINLSLPIANGLSGIELELLSGNLPKGSVLANNSIRGTLAEVTLDTEYEFVIRAFYQGYFEDQHFKIIVVGPDNPAWISQEGLLPVGPNDTLFILDNEFIDFQLLATDDDILAGQVLDFYIANDDGVLPPGLTLSRDGKITGTTEPLLSLDKRYRDSGYDAQPFGDIPLDYGQRNQSGYSSFFYDSQPFGYFEELQTYKKLNRYYPFAVTVTDGISEVRREFQIYVVGDDFLTADNTVMQAGTGVFRADTTNVRSPVWITPRNLGIKRANNYTTIFLDIIDDPTLVGTEVFELEDFNDDGSISELPEGLSLQSNTGEISGYIPYQPAVTKNYKFTIKATRIQVDYETVTVFGTYYEDVVMGAKEFKIYKTDLTASDGINDLEALVNKQLFINNALVTVTGYDDTNNDYDIITLLESVSPKSSLVIFKTAQPGQNFVYVNSIPQSQKDEYANRTLKVDGNSYVVQSINRFLTYEINSHALDNTTVNDLKTYLQTTYGGSLVDYEVNIVESHRWQVTLPDTSFTRFLAQFKEKINAFLTYDSSPAEITIVARNFDKITFSGNIVAQLDKNRNIGLALLKDDFFKKNLIVSSVDETTQPTKSKTFELAVIGEIDSNIVWNTPADLGTVQTNKPTYLFVEAETVNIESPMLYDLTAGTLPQGIELSYRGLLIGSPQTWKDSANDSSEFLYEETFKFTVRARDRFGLNATSREFTLKVVEPTKMEYTDIVAKPLLETTMRKSYKEFMTNPEIFDQTKIYRVSDPMFGIKREMEMLIYAGIEKSLIDEFVSAAAKNHKRKKYILGAPTKAVAKQPGQNTPIYEVVYIPVIDTAESKTGLTKKSFSIETKNKITVDSVQYSALDDNSKIGSGESVLAIEGRNTVKFVYQKTTGTILIETRDGDVKLNVDKDDFEVELRDGGEAGISIKLELLDSEPKRLRPIANTIKVDSDAIKISQSTDNVRHRVSLEHMRSNIRAIGDTDRDYLPLWMRTPQDGVVQTEHTNAVVLCYCNPGDSDAIIKNITESNFNFKNINFDLDRYIIKNSIEDDKEKYILFANYQFNI